MATRDKHDDQEPKQEVLDTAIVAYHIVAALLNGKRVLDVARVTRIANGILTRLRDLWQDWPVFLASLAELEPLPVQQPADVTEAEAKNQEVATMLLVLRAACESFLGIYGQPPQREFGFHRGEE